MVSTRESIAAPWTAHACAVMLGIIGVVRLALFRQSDGLTLIGLAILVEVLVRSEARMLEDGGYFEDGVFGYDFSEGYTSLESGCAEGAAVPGKRAQALAPPAVRPAPPAADDPRGGRRETDGRDPRKAAPRGTQRLDRRRASFPRSREHPLSQPDQEHVIEPIRPRRDRTGLPDHRGSLRARLPGADPRANRAVAPGARRGHGHPACRSGARSPERRSGALVLEPPRSRSSRSTAATSPAGADAVLTNTFGANRCWLARFGQVRACWNRSIAAAVELARSAAGPDRFVMGSMGPTAGTETGAAAEQATILVDEGVDALLLETFRFPEVEPVLEEVTAALRRPVPVFVSLWEWPDEPRPAAQTAGRARSRRPGAQLPARRSGRGGVRRGAPEKLARSPAGQAGRRHPPRSRDEPGGPGGRRAEARSSTTSA